MAIVLHSGKENDLYSSSGAEFICRFGPHVQAKQHVVDKWIGDTMLLGEFENRQKTGLFVDGRKFSSEKLAQWMQVLMNHGVTTWCLRLAVWRASRTVCR